MKSDRGNVTLTNEELMLLREAVSAKYALSAGKSVEEISKLFNSNIQNYTRLSESINESTLAPLVTISPKFLVVIFYYSKSNPSKRTFRKRYIDALYSYAHGEKRNNVFLSKSNMIGQDKKLEGHWRCFYSKNNLFQKNLETAEGGKLSVVALTIEDENASSAKVYFKGSHWGNGLVEIVGSNLNFQLKDKKTNEPIYLLMNCGRPIRDSVEHIRYAAGVCLYINRSGFIKSAQCFMQYFDKPDEEFKVSKLDINSADFEKTFNPEFIISNVNIKHPKLSRIIRFFKKEHITTDVNIADLIAVD